QEGAVQDGFGKGAVHGTGPPLLCHGGGDEGFEGALLDFAQHTRGHPALLVQDQGGGDGARRNNPGDGQEHAAVFVVEAGVGQVEGLVESLGGGFFIAEVDAEELHALV